jgi:hypothetical protein
MAARSFRRSRALSAGVVVTAGLVAPGTAGASPGTQSVAAPSSASATQTSSSSPAQPDAGPLIDVTWPKRGSFNPYGFVFVQGTVTSSFAVTQVTVNGTPVTLDSKGGFVDVVVLGPGLNVITVEATDTLGVVNKDTRAVLSGRFQPDGQAIQDGLSIRLNQGTLDAVARVLETKLSGQTIASAILARNPLASTSGFWGSSAVSCSSASLGNPTITFAPKAGVLQVHVQVPTVSIKLREVGSGIVPNLTGYATCDEAVVDASMAISVANGRVTTSIVNDSASLKNFSWGINGLPSFLTGLFTGAVQSAIQGEIDSLVKSVVPPEVEKAIAGATGQPITQQIQKNTATFTLAPSSVSIDSSGLSVTVDADCTLSRNPGYTPLAAPGSLLSGGSVAQNGGPGPDFFASINEDLLNRAGYAAWKSGVANLRIDGTPSSPFHMPSGYPLNMGLLETFLPELQGVGSPSDGLAIAVTPLLPPVFRAMPAPNVLEANLGELQLDFIDTVTNATVLTLAAHARVGASVTLGAQSTFEIHLSDRPEIEVSLVSSAAKTLNAIGIDNVGSLFLPTIVQMAGNQWSGFPLPLYPGLTPVQTSIYWDGPQETFVTCAGNFHPGASLPAGKPAPAPPTTASVSARAIATLVRGHTLGPKANRIAFAPRATASVPKLTLSSAGFGFSKTPLTGLGIWCGSSSSFPTQVTRGTGYVALVEDGLETAMTPLLKGYQSRGVNVALVPLSQVVAPGRDRAEQIRNWLVAHCHDGVKRHLLLVGGPNAIPFRTCTPAPKLSVVSDLYYGDLTGSWDSNGNGVYGEIADSPGFDADLYVGRLPFDDAASVATAVQAIEAARANKGPSSKRCLLVGATTLVPGDDAIAAQTVRSQSFDPDGWQTTTAYAPESWLKGDLVLGPDTIVNDLTSNPSALLMTFSHGSTTNLKSHPNSTTWNDVLTIPQLSQIPGTPPPVEIAVACDTADPTNGPCIGSISLQNGFAGWVGCTVVTDPLSGAGAWLLSTAQLGDEVADGKSLGQSIADMVRDFMATGLVGTQGDPAAQAVLYQQGMSWICYGDPGLCVGPKAP